MTSTTMMMMMMMMMSVCQDCATSRRCGRSNHHSDRHDSMARVPA